MKAFKQLDAGTDYIIQKKLIDYNGFMRHEIRIIGVGEMEDILRSFPISFYTRQQIAAGQVQILMDEKGFISLVRFI